MLEQDKLDLVVIASPTPFHYEQVKAAMERGVDVFLEKPMAVSLEEADKMIGLKEKYNRKFMVFQPRRTDGDLQTLKKILQSGTIGPVYMIKCCKTSDYVRRNDWQALKKNGGGMLNNYGSHGIDQLLYLTGSKAKNITCHLRAIATVGDADDVVKAVIETENGIIIDLDINRATAFPFPEWTVLGKYGSISYIEENEERLFKIRYLKEEELPNLPLFDQMAAPGRRYEYEDKLIWHEMTVPVERGGDQHYYDYCYTYYSGEGEPFVPVSDTREVMRILDECRKGV
jgi:predicted dehydrogenase